MKVKPNKIKYTDILANNPIKNIIDIIGFLFIIIAIPHSKAIKLIISKDPVKYPLEKISLTVINCA
jgi:hypothetical protein